MSDYFKKLQKQKAFGEKVNDESNKDKAQKDYKKQAKVFLAAHPNCAVKSPVCIGTAQGVHHIRGRIGVLLLDQRFWIPSCNPCNSYIESHSEFAKVNGFKLSKHSPKK